MKPIPIIITLLVLAIAGFLFMRSTSESPTKAVAPSTPVTADTETPAIDTTSDLEVSRVDVGSDTPLGTDINMEFPTIDSADADKGTSPEARTFDVHGANFSFDVKEIRVKAGDTVTVNFTNTEGTHDFVLDEFNARTPRIQGGSSAKVTFVASKKGTYEYYCSVGNHRAMGMVGKLIVE